MYRIRISLVCALMLCFAPPVSAEIYRWVDSAGRVHFGDQPPTDASRVRQMPSQSLPETPPAAKAREASQRAPVTLFTSACGQYCDQANDYLKTRGIPYSLKFIDRDPDAARALRQLTGMPLQVPVIKIGDSVQKGFDKALWGNLLDLAGYPRASGAPDAAGTAKPSP